MIQIHTEKLTGVTVSGSLSVNTHKFEGIIKHVIVSPTNLSTTYNISIVNPFNIKIYDRTSETGIMSELTRIPVSGVYTVTISSATSDENFIILLVTQTL